MPEERTTVFTTPDSREGTLYKEAQSRQDPQTPIENPTGQGQDSQTPTENLTGQARWR